MKPIIQRGLDALEARIRALEAAIVRAFATLVLQAPGRLLGETILTGSGSYVQTPGTRAMQVRMVGGGGGGGGGVEGVGVGIGGGGGSGAYLEFALSGGAVAGGVYACGTGGLGGLVNSFNGSTGGDTSLTVQGVTYLAKGGTGGTTTSNATTHLGPIGGAPQDGSTSGSFIAVTAGDAGLHGFYDSDGGIFWSGAGGSSPLGGGGAPVNSGAGGTRGVNGSGAGSGGGGANVTTQPRAGGTGAAGRIIIREFS